MVPGRVKEFVDTFLHLESHEIFAGYYSPDPGVKESFIKNFCSFHTQQLSQKLRN